MQRGVDITSAHRLDQCARDVIVLVASPVIADRGMGHGLLDLGQHDRDGRVADTARRLCVQGNSRGCLQGGEHPARITTCHPYDVLPSVLIEGENPCQSTLFG